MFKIGNDKPSLLLLYSRIRDYAYSSVILYKLTAASSASIGNLKLCQRSSYPKIKSPSEYNLVVL